MLNDSKWKSACILFQQVIKFISGGNFHMAKPNQKPRPEICLADKLLWTIREASAYSGIGESRLRTIAKEDECPFSLRVGRKICIKRKEFQKFLSNASEL
jgi:Excisionase from transposon Tn916.